MSYTSLMSIILILKMIFISKYVIQSEYSFPLVQIRNETTRSLGIYVSKFKRVYVDFNEWLPETQCSFYPRFVQYRLMCNYCSNIMNLWCFNLFRTFMIILFLVQKWNAQDVA